MASTALILSVLAILLVVAMRTTPCANAASGSCSVGDTETFSGDITVDGNITFKSETANEYTFVHTATSARIIGLPDADVVTGSLMAGITANSLGLLAVGTNNFVLTADSGETTGMKWAAAPAADAQMGTGSYTGNGSTSQAITGIGFQVKHVEIIRRSTTASDVFGMLWTSDVIIDDNASGLSWDDASNMTSAINKINALGADGFTVDDGGTDSDPNASGITYNYTVWGD